MSAPIFYAGMNLAHKSYALFRDLGSPRSEYHITLIYSRAMPTQQVSGFLTEPFNVPITAIEYWNNDGREFTVARVASAELTYRNAFYQLIGCKSDFSDFRPHITLETGGDFREKYKSLVGKSVLLTYEYIEIFEEKRG